MKIICAYKEININLLYFFAITKGVYKDIFRNQRRDAA